MAHPNYQFHLSVWGLVLWIPGLSDDSVDVFGSSGLQSNMAGKSPSMGG